MFKVVDSISGALVPQNSGLAKIIKNVDQIEDFRHLVSKESQSFVIVLLTRTQDLIRAEVQVLLRIRDNQL